MIVHIVLLQARPDLSAYDEETLGEALYSLAEVPGVHNMTWGPDFSNRAHGYTHGAVIHFADRDALQRYQDDPRHKQVVEIFDRLTEDRLVLDYEAGPELK